MVTNFVLKKRYLDKYFQSLNCCCHKLFSNTFFLLLFFSQICLSFVICFLASKNVCHNNFSVAKLFVTIQFFVYIFFLLQCWFYHTFCFIAISVSPPFLFHHKFHKVLGPTDQPTNSYTSGAIRASKKFEILFGFMFYVCYADYKKYCKSIGNGFSINKY